DTAGQHQYPDHHGCRKARCGDSAVRRRLRLWSRPHNVSVSKNCRSMGEDDVMGKISRRTILAGTIALAGVTHGNRRARAAEFNLKYGNDLPAAHPINKRAAEACDAIRSATNGRVDIQIFPNSQLGGSTDMLSQVRSGALDIFTVGSPLANLIPVSAIPSIA